jgi:hypothetical protein
VDWTPFQKEQVVRVMGLEAHHDFDVVAPPIWRDFLTDGKTADAVERVLRAKFRKDADDPDAPDVTPYISRRTAREIVKGSFAPQDLTVEGTIHGIMPLAFAPRSGAEQYEAFQDDDDEDQATYISTEVIQARWLKATAKAKAPKNYTYMMDALRASSMVWTVLFDGACPLVMSLNILRSAGAPEGLNDSQPCGKFDVGSKHGFPHIFPGPV